MSIRALRTLISIHRHGSFRAASEVEHITPAAVSQQMRNLEIQFNLELFDRSMRSPKLTATGLALVGEAQAVVTAYDNLAEKLGPSGKISGELILGAVHTTLTGFVPLALSELKKAHSGIRVRVVPGLTNQLLSQIDRGQIHAAVISKPQVLPRYLKFTEIAVEDMVLLKAESTPVAQPEKLLQTLPFIRFSRDAVVGRLIDNWLQDRGIIVNDTMELESLEAISSLVAAHIGISIVPQRCVRTPERLPLKTVPLGKGSPRRALGLVSRLDSPQVSAINAAETALLAAKSIGAFSFL